MSDCFDHMVDAYGYLCMDNDFTMSEDETRYGSSDDVCYTGRIGRYRTPKTCKYCGKRGLHWEFIGDEFTASRWRLCYISGKEHNCYA